MISMRKILFSLLLAVLGAFAASGAGERDVTLAEGQTLKFFPARALMTGATLESGADCVELQRVGALVILRGLKAGEATARIALRGGESLPMRIHVLQNTFSYHKPAPRTISASSIMISRPARPTCSAMSPGSGM